MTFAVESFRHPAATQLDPTFYRLKDSSGAQAEIWPALGFNCVRWQVQHAGQALDLLYTDPQLFAQGRPTRSGIPVLFPFPNRIRAGCFTWQGKSYELPRNDSTSQNAIHGFACRKPWRVTDQGADATSAWVTGEFQGSRDAPESRDHWPADYILRLTYRLASRHLRLEAEVIAPGPAALPFGLGYHPYFRVPLAPGARADACTIEVPACDYWELADSLPSGVIKPVDASRDLTRPRRYTDLQLDDVLTGLDRRQRPGGAAGLSWNGSLRQADSGLELAVFSSRAFRELVVFTPVHREAFCLEPYTCTTDAINLQAKGVDAGWLELAPGSTWNGVVELRLG